MKTRDYNPPMTKKEIRLYQEINRFYKANGSTEKLCKSRSLGMYQNVGRFYILDTYRNTVLYLNVNPERLFQEIIKLNVKNSI